MHQNCSVSNKRVAGLTKRERMTFCFLGLEASEVGECIPTMASSYAPHCFR